MVHRTKILDHYSIVDPATASSTQPSSSPDSNAKVEVASPEPARFPGDDGGKSLAEMAQRDLEAALQLLAERAQYITGASGSAIALLEGNDMICRASAGPSAPELGAEVQVKTGLTGESVRTRQVLRCDDAETDSRVNRESCRSLGIRSVMVMPLVRDQKVLGVFELMADRPQAFEERDVTALERLAEMVLTGLDHADAAKRALTEIAAKNAAAVTKQKESESAIVPADQKERASETASSHGPPQETVVLAPEPESQPQTIEKIKNCQACGFPVSGGRTLCLDCEAARIAGESPVATASNEAPAFLSQFGTAGREGNWLQSHFYTIGTILMVALTLVLLALRLR
jgi:GAF domain-containing protein